MINGEPAMWSVGDADGSGWRTLEFRSDLVTLQFHWDGEAYVN